MSQFKELRILWSGEIGDVRDVHAWSGRAGWPQGMTKIPPPTPVPETLDWDFWLGVAAFRPFTASDDEYRAFVAERNSRHHNERVSRGLPERGAFQGTFQS